MLSDRIDPFFYKQPPLSFIEQLREPVHMEKPEWFGRKEKMEGEASVNGIHIINEFLDEEQLLETAIRDINTFFTIYEIKGHQYPVNLVKIKTECFEAYRIQVTNENCMIEAEDTEGIRRALIFLEDELHRRAGAFLPIGTIDRKPMIRTRITRGFFSPTNRPPKNQDELLDDIDYYPDEYLNRLAHDGTNGIWIYTYFNQLLPSAYFIEYGADSEKRIRKLKRIVKKCKRYGIKVYVFGVEPFALDPDLAEKYRDSIGGKAWNGRYTICTYSEAGAKYCVEVTQRLMEKVPDLGGIIDITYGERPTSCASLDNYCACPRCRMHGRSEIIAHNVDLLKEGIRRAGVDADFISWTYAHRITPMEEIEDYVRRAPSDAVLMENFEDAGYTKQLGKTRYAVDYWLSYVGPSQMFTGAAKAALREGKKMYAKMQVCCSHELATVPYIPVPGILFEKYAKARKYQVQGVMQCWYFGNYPSLMSKCAGELAFISDFSDKTSFLHHLAGIYYGENTAETVLAWNHFENGYRQYPVNIMFSYYGPMHDGVVWDLALLPKDHALPRSWQLLDKPDGDRIGECLQSGHTLQEAIVLTDKMLREWKAGINALPVNKVKEQETVAKALLCLISSGNNILRFYELRSMLGKSMDDSCNKLNILKKMEEIVDREIDNSSEMIKLCRMDPRLGYHSEAEGYKFFPEKLQERIHNLKNLKKTEFEFVQRNIQERKPPIPWYLGNEKSSYSLRKGCIEESIYERISDTARFRASYDDKKLYLEVSARNDTVIMIYFEFELMWPDPGILIRNGVLELCQSASTHQSVVGDKVPYELSKYKLTRTVSPDKGYLLCIERIKTGWVRNVPIRMMIKVDGESWISEETPVHTLGKNDTSPGEFGWLLPEDWNMPVENL